MTDAHRRTGRDAATAASDPVLWWAPLDLLAPAMRDLESSLCPEERSRADGFHRAIDRRRFVAARGWLRRLVADQLSCAANEVQIVTGAHGKPRVIPGELRFNASRSGDVALYATSWKTEVGVDIEAIRDGTDIDGIAARYFSAAEQRDLAGLAPPRRRAAVFECWTRKEAYLKCIGTGLTTPLRDVDTSYPPGHHAVISGCSVHQVDVAEGFASALAAHGGSWAPDAARRLTLSKRTSGR